MTLTDFEVIMDINMDESISCTEDHCNNDASWIHQSSCCDELLCNSHHEYYLALYRNYLTVKCTRHSNEIFSDDISYRRI